MRFFSSALALAAVPAAVLGATWNVTVGADGMQQFVPETIKAAKGDMVNFMFMAKNHSVTQSLFASPCTKAMFNGTAGANSGFVLAPPNVTADSAPMWSITIKDDTTPLWMYCAQKNPVVHCHNGMVFSINPSADKTHEAFVAAAKASADNSTTPAGGDPAAANSTTPAGGDPAAASQSGAAPSSDASGAAPSSSAAPPDGASAGAASGASPSDSSSAAAATGSGVAAAAQAGSSAASAADNAPTSGASRTVLARGAAGLFTVAAAVGAVLL